MGRTRRTLDIVDAALREAVGFGLCHVEADDAPLDGRRVEIDGRPRLNFTSCSYLGLELDPRLVRGATNALERYGTQFSASRGYISAPLYAELEELLDRIFGAHTLVLPNTTLAHFSALPVIVDEDDAVLLDHQVHQSVHMAIPQVRQQGSHVEIVRHGRMDLLEERIRDLESQHPRVWYLADGVYSMYGDFAPMKALSWLLERHEQLHLYIDDAHGMSWTGEHGCGFAAESLRGHPRAVIAVSLNKAFAAGGGALVFPSRSLHARVKNCAGPFIFTGPLQPPLLGAAVASAAIHLSDAMPELQAELRERVRLANRTARELDLPLASACEVPIRFVAVSKKAAAFELASRLLERGFFVNPSAFPVVGPRNAGIRFTLTRHHSLDDVRALLEAVAELLPGALAHAGVDRSEVARAFGLAPPLGSTRGASQAALSCAHETSVGALDAGEWDALLGERGTFDAATLALLEETFGPHQSDAGRWRFHYYQVRDAGGRPLLATFFTHALWKDDLLAAAKVSREVERRRQRDPLFLTSPVLAMGSLLTEGEQLFLDREGPWRDALALLLAALEEEREECDAPAVVIRDVAADDGELGAALEEEGFVRVELPDSLVIDVDWSDREEFLAARTRRERRFHREHVLPFEEQWDVEVLRAGEREVTSREWDHLHQLYLQVQGRQLALNTFPLPPDLLPRLLGHPEWELLLLRLRPEHGGDPHGFAQGFMAARAEAQTYSPVLVGMDYAFVESHGLYRQLLAQTVWRAQALGARRVAFGMGSELEKARFGARPVQRVLYVQSHDRYHHDVLELIASNPTHRDDD